MYPLPTLRRGYLALIAFLFLATAFPLASSAKSTGTVADVDEGRSQYGLASLADPQKAGDFLFTILGAVGLAAVIAYHPFHRRWSVDDLDQPKTIITYAMVGALASLIVAPEPTLAYVIFGIGGLLRFRTDVGTAKDTGRAILGTIIGLTCGMGFWLPAVYGTAVAWILFAILESRMSMRMTVRGLSPEILQNAAGVYASALRSFGCKVVSVRRNQLKGQLVYVMKVKRDFEPDQVEIHLRQAISADLQGSITWPDE